MKEVVIVGGARTAVGDFFGAVKDVSAIDLGIVAFKGALEKAGITPEQVESIVAGHTCQAGVPGNIARLISLNAGCKVESYAATVHQQCPSSMRAAEILSHEIMLGKVEIGAAVGTESMTNVPYVLNKARRGYRLGDGEPLLDSMFVSGLICPWNGYHMGVTAENIAEMYNISREEQDQLALMSHQRASQAIEKGWFKDEIVPVEVKTKKGTTIFDTDEHVKANTTLEALAQLKPAFKKGGTVTAGNASGLNDAASSIIMMSADKAKELNIKPLARVVASASGGVDPKIMGMSVVPAVQRALKFAGLQQSDIGYWEINEAFAAQVLGVNRELKIDWEILNGVGGGVSIGHPVGATGCRLIITLINEMKRRNVRYGCASLCASGGPGVAFIVESI